MNKYFLKITLPVLSIIIVTSVVILVKNNATFIPEPPTETTSPSGNNNSNTPTFTKSDSPIVTEDIYNNNVPFTKADQIYVAEMDFLYFVLENAKAKGWSGNEKDPFPIQKSEFPQSKIETYAKDNDRLYNGFTIPENLRPLFMGTEAKTAIRKDISKAYQEFISYLTWKKVASKYISEIETNALPDQDTRIMYHDIDGYDNPPSAVQGFMDSSGHKEDFSQLQMDLYAGDLYNHTRTMVKSAIFGPVPTDTNSSEYIAYYRHARDLGLRYLMFHEMGHVLERAVDTQNSKPEDKKDKSTWSDATKSMWRVSNKYYWKWDTIPILSDLENHNLSQESQAEGISFETLTAVYNMSPAQKRLIWEYLFGRLADARDNYDKSMQILATYPNYSCVSIGTKIFNDFIKQYELGEHDANALYEVEKRMGNLSGYGGYFHPMLPEDMPLLWEYIKD